MRLVKLNLYAVIHSAFSRVTSHYWVVWVVPEAAPNCLRYDCLDSSINRCVVNNQSGFVVGVLGIGLVYILQCLFTKGIRGTVMQKLLQW